MNEWTYNGNNFTSDDIDNWFGFVYIIKNLDKDKFYIGQKQFWSTIKRPPLKGKKKKRIVTKESDWKSYTGSSKQLNEDILSGDRIQKTILKLCSSKSSLTYNELKYQLSMDCLELFHDDKCYNGIINVRLSAVCIPNIIKDK